MLQPNLQKLNSFSPPAESLQTIIQSAEMRQVPSSEPPRQVVVKGKHGCYWMADKVPFHTKGRDVLNGYAF